MSAGQNELDTVLAIGNCGFPIARGHDPTRNPARTIRLAAHLNVGAGRWRVVHGQRIRAHRAVSGAGLSWPARTWLFQAQPRSFDIDGFLATNPTEFVWLARQHAADILPGNRVFVWRAIGGGDPTKSGVIAEARVIASAAQLPEDPASMHFWRDPADAADAQMRLQLRLLRVADRRQVLQRDWLSEDPVLREMAIFRMAQGTNYPVPAEQAVRLDALWSRVGRDWSYAESVAGLWAYVQTYDGAVSRLSGSPVADVALAIGRVVPGVYNKVMNFRSIDPRDPRAGLSGAGAMDRKIWALFYDAASSTMRSAALEAEYHSLWSMIPADQLPEAEGAPAQDFEREVVKLTALSLTDLGARLGAAVADTAPAVLVTRTQRFKRDPLVAAYARVRGTFRCEMPGCAHPVFEGWDGRPYSEVHHIEPLAEGGADVPANVASLCPAHHREAHHGQQAQVIRAALARLRQPNL